MPLSFLEFLSQTAQNPVLATTVLLTSAVLLVNGWTDAPNAIAGVVVTGALSFPAAALLAAICNFLGVLCVTAVTASVAETIYSIAVFGGGPEMALTGLCAAMTAIILWATAAWRLGIPTSESHALVAGLSGAAAAVEGTLACIRWDNWNRVLLGLLLSVFIGFFLGRWTQRRMNRGTASRIPLRSAQLLGAAGVAFLHGAQDGQKFLGIFMLGVTLAQGSSDSGSLVIPFWLMGVCASLMAMGTLFGGRRIIDKIGREMVSLRPQDGLAADFGSILGLLIATVLGLPVSTTHTRTAALLGAGSNGTSPVNWKVAREILLAWALTFPGCMAVGFWTAKLFLSLFCP